MSLEQTVLIIGAGRHGRTGAAVLDKLVSLGGTVRVLARNDDARTDELRERGAHTIFGDLHDRNTLRAAVAGVSAVYFAYPIATGVVAATANLASMLVESGQRPHVVVMSMAVASHTSPSRLGQAQAVAEEILAWARLNPTILRVGALFYENVLVLHGGSIREHGLIASSFGAARAPWISARDAAELAARQLLLPAPSSPEVTYPPGAEALSHTDIAEIISIEISRNVEYRPILGREWQELIEAQAASSYPSPLNDAMALHISAIGSGFSTGNAPTVQPDPDALAAALGHQPITFAEFVREQRHEFSDSLG